MATGNITRLEGVWPETHERAVRDSAGVNLETKLGNINTNISQLDQKTTEQILNKYLVGNGDTFVSQFTQGLVPGRTYRVLLKNHNWDMAGVTINTNYRFTVVSVYNNVDTILAATRLTETMQPYYDVKIPTNSEYIRVGGRAATGAKIEYCFEDLTETLPRPYDIGWPKCYTKADAVKKVLFQSKYVFIFPINDEAYIYSTIGDGYSMLVGIYNTYDDAVYDTNRVRYCGSGYFQRGTAAAKQQYRVGTTGAVNGFVAFIVSKPNSGNLSASDATAIENSLSIEMYPKSSQVQMREYGNKAKLANALPIELGDVWPYVSDSNGDVVTNNTRVKFFDMNFLGNKRVSVDISAALVSVPTLEYSFGVWGTLAGAQENSGSDRKEIYSDGNWKTTNADNWILKNAGVFNLYFHKSGNVAFTLAEIQAVRAGVVLSINDVIEPIEPIDYSIFSINHRGYSTVAPENTLPAFILSRKMGFKYVETDVAFTEDDVAVLMHDETINRTARNSDGSALSSTINIYDITYAEALEYDYGIWMGAKWAGTPIPTFDQFIQTCKELSLHPFIELKDSITWTTVRCDIIADAIKAVGMEKNVSFISFDKDALAYMTTLFPEATIGLGYKEDTYSAEAFAAFIADCVALKTSTNKVLASVRYSSMSSSLYEIAAEDGINTIVWTVNSANDAKNLDDNTVGVLSDSLNAGALIIDDLFATLPAGV